MPRSQTVPTPPARRAPRPKAVPTLTRATRARPKTVPLTHASRASSQDRRHLHPHDAHGLGAPNAPTARLDTRRPEGSGLHAPEARLETKRPDPPREQRISPAHRAHAPTAAGSLLDIWNGIARRQAGGLGRAGTSGFAPADSSSLATASAACFARNSSIGPSAARKDRVRLGRLVRRVRREEGDGLPDDGVFDSSLRFAHATGRLLASLRDRECLTVRRVSPPHEREMSRMDQLVDRFRQRAGLGLRSFAAVAFSLDVRLVPFASSGAHRARAWRRGVAGGRALGHPGEPPQPRRGRDGTRALGAASHIAVRRQPTCGAFHVRESVRDAGHSRTL